MILHAIEVQNWKRLTQVELHLQPGVNIIHGPTRIGKSSLVEALRAALLDYHHDSADEAVRLAAPWGQDAVPKVAVEFEIRRPTDEERSGLWRVEKVFSRLKEGGARLLRERDGEWQEECSNKEVLGAVRELLATDKSTAGIAGLLWVPQGQVGLPEVDVVLQKDLEAALGTIVTGRDAEFRAALWKRLEKWFSSDDGLSKGKHRGSSELPALERLVAEKEEQVHALERRFAETDADLQRLADVEQQIAEANADLRASEEEVGELEARDARLAQKREKCARLEAQVEQAQTQVSEAESTLASLRDHQRRRDEIAARLANLRPQCASLADLRQQAETAYEQARSQRREASAAVQALQGQRNRLQAMRELLQAARGIETVERRLGDAAAQAKQRAELEQELARTPAPGPADIKRAEQGLQRLQQLEAELRAAQLEVVIVPERPGEVGVELDRSGETVIAEPGQEIRRHARQRAQVSFEGVGRVEVHRGAEDAAVENLAAERDELDQSLQASLVRWGLQEASREEIVPTLRAWVLKRQQLTQELDRVARQLAAIVPDGEAAAREQLADLCRQRENLWAARSDLRGQEPSEETLQAAQAELAEEEQRRAEEERQATAAEEDSQQQLQRVRDEEAGLRQQLEAAQRDLAGPEALIEDLRRRHGDEQDLQARIEAAAAELGDRRQELAAHALTDEEQRLPRALGEARTARDKRRQRLHEAQLEEKELRTKLREMEGLQGQRVAAEQELADARRRFDELLLQVSAHVRLLELFDDLRRQSVEAAIAPVSALVSRWLDDLYGDDRVSLTFGDDFGVAAVQRPDSPTQKVAFVTSYGEREQLSTLVRLAYAVTLAREEPQVVFLDDPFAHSDRRLHRRMLDILQDAARENLQVIVLTCHPSRFDHLGEVPLLDLEELLQPPSAG